MTRTLFDPPDGPDADHAGPAGEHDEQTKDSDPATGANGAAADRRGVDHRETDGSAAEADGDGAAAELGKLRAMARLAGRHAGRVLAAQRAMIRLLLGLPEGDPITIDDVRCRLGELGADPRWLGAAVHGLRAAGLIERVGFMFSTRRVSHGRPISAWVLRNRAAAEAWMKANPPTGGDGGA